MPLPSHKNSLDTIPLVQFAQISDRTIPALEQAFQSIKPFADTFADTFPEWGTSKYRWPIYPMEAWSRVWEYPFVAHIVEEVPHKDMILDVGSATTFFPFYLAKAHNSTVVGLDPDPYHLFHFSACAHQVQKKMGVQRLPMPIQTGSEAIPFPDETFDIVYSVSVIEHIPNPIPAIQEMTRVLKQGGTLILTLDTNYPFSQAASGLTESSLRALLAALSELYSLPLDIPAHPGKHDILTFQTSHIQRNASKRPPLRYFLRQPAALITAIRSKIQRLFSTTQSPSERPENLAVLAVVLTKPSRS
jgi:SAM-dependent methyltransferase